MRISRLRLGAADSPDIEVILTGQSSTSTTGLFGNVLDKDLIGNFGLFEYGGYSYLVDENGAYIIDENGSYISSSNPSFSVEHDNPLTGQQITSALGFLASLGDVIAALT
ncbi:MAG: hypothetical protein DRQ62_13105, partial [Gammaproteobacteria bacterium]